MKPEISGNEASDKQDTTTAKDDFLKAFQPEEPCASQADKPKEDNQNIGDSTDSEAVIVNTGMYIVYLLCKGV